MTGESRSMEQNVLERSGLMKDFLSEKINGLKRERLKEIREKFESNVGNVRKQFESVLGAITSEAEQEIIVISYLRASYITETHEFYVGVYKGEPFVEEIKHGFISVKPLLGNVEKDFVELDQALERAIDNGVKNLVVQPTHLMHGAEYDELTAALEGYKDKFESIKIAEPLLGEVGADATVINADKAAVAEAITAEAVKDAGFDSLDAVKEDGTAFVFMGHGTSHTAKVSYSQMQTQMENLGLKNAFIGTVEGKPEDTACDKVIEKVKEAGYKNVVLRPLMVVAGDHANNDMAGDDADSWKSQFEASGDFDSVDCQIAGLGRIAAVEDLYVAHTKAAIDSLGASDDAAAEDTDAKATDDSADDAQADDAAETTADTAEADAE